MESCCQKKGDDLKALAKKQAWVLWTVLGINLVMFVFEFASGYRFESLSLSGDSLDMLGDALAYGSSLFVLGGTTAAKGRASQLKGSLMLTLGLVVATMAIYRTFVSANPVAIAMGWVGATALLANGICLALLTRHKNDDINFKSVWVCSRNDIIANVSVIVAAWLVMKTESMWPDLIIGLGIAALFVKSAFSVLREGNLAIRQTPGLPA